MDLSTVIGLLFGVISIFGSFMLEGGSMGALIMIPAMLIVFGGTLATAMVGVSLQKFFGMFKLIKIALFPQKVVAQDLIAKMMTYATTVRKEGILALEREAKNIEHPFLRKGIRLMVDGSDPDYLREVLESEMEQIAERHAQGAAIFQKMGGYSPTMGIIGTVMGLIVTLANAGEDPNTLIHHIATAFIATLWGVFMANIVWLPIADKLKFRHQEEMMILNLIMIGIISIQSGANPSFIRTKLEALLPSRQQASALVEEKSPHEEKARRRA